MSILVAVDLDDVLNDLTGVMCKEYGCGRLSFDDILEGNYEKGFENFRVEFLNRRESWGLPPTQFALEMMEYLNSQPDTKVVILTKTPTVKGRAWVSECKINFKNRWFPNNDMFLVAGDKSLFKSDIIIDDLKGNCEKHKKINNSSALLYRIGITSIEDIKQVLEDVRSKN